MARRGAFNLFTHTHALINTKIFFYTCFFALLFFFIYIINSRMVILKLFDYLFLSQRMKTAHRCSRSEMLSCCFVRLVRAGLISARWLWRCVSSMRFHPCSHPWAFCFPNTSVLNCPLVALCSECAGLISAHASSSISSTHPHFRLFCENCYNHYTQHILRLYYSYFLFCSHMKKC